MDHTIKILNSDNGNLIHTLYRHTYTVRCVAILPNENVCSASDYRTVKILNSNNGRDIRTLKTFYHRDIT